MAMRAVGQETCIRPHAHPALAPAAALLGLQGLPGSGAVVGRG